jgi:short-subunit dehydrogenase
MEPLVKWAEGRDVGVLVNNVGIHQGGSKVFPLIDPKKITESVNVNCLYPTLLTSAILTRVFLKRSARCLIINMASVVGCSSGVPSMAVYAATKAFNHSFSVSLSADLFNTNVDVLCVNPGLTSSKMTKMATSLLCSSAEECAEGALNKCGLVDVLPHWKHAAMWVAMAVGDWVPAVPRAWIMNVVIGVVKLPGE